MNLQDLHAEFPRTAVSWRAQTVTKAGDKALALAYIDARDVMNRLDDVCGPENWQSHIEETAKGRVLATISIRIGDVWVAKCDGAGATDIEGDKGGISDALKRAAVQWGIGRYLYDLESPWVPCESSEYNGKKQWKKWTADPWSCVRASPVPAPVPSRSASRPAPDASPGLSDSDQAMLGAIEARDSVKLLEDWRKAHGPAVNASPNKKLIVDAYTRRIEAVRLMDKVAA